MGSVNQGFKLDHKKILKTSCSNIKMVENEILGLLP
jgi:hypothetical protein